jgi:hypothetical protein
MGYDEDLQQLPHDTPLPRRDGDSQDFVAREVFGVDNYSALTGNFATDLDLIEDDAFFEVSNLAKWWVYTDPQYTGPANAADASTNAIPAVFSELFRSMWAAKAIRRFHNPQKGAMYFKEHTAPLFERVAQHFEALTEFNDPTTPSTAMSVNSLRRAAIAVLVRQRTPVVPPFVTSRTTIVNEYNKLWEERRWMFKIRHVKVTIDTSGNILLPDPPEGEQQITVDGIASKHIIVMDAQNIRYDIAWLDSERFVQAAARYDGDTGRPRFFFLEDKGSLPPIIRLLPTPDTTYTAFMNVLMGPPAITSDVATEAFDRLPLPLRAHLQNRVTGTMIHQWGKEDNDSLRWLNLIEKERAMFGPEWDYKGSHEFSARGHHHHDFIRSLASFRGVPILGQLD